VSKISVRKDRSISLVFARKRKDNAEARGKQQVGV